MKKQRVLTGDSINGVYYNFFYTPGSIDSMSTMIRDGWLLVNLKDSGKSFCAVFEKDDSKTGERLKLVERLLMENLKFTQGNLFRPINWEKEVLTYFEEFPYGPS